MLELCEKSEACCCSRYESLTFFDARELEVFSDRCLPSICSGDMDQQQLKALSSKEYDPRKKVTLEIEK